MKKRMIIIRHAEAVGNVIREFHGWTDESITDRGILQAQRVAERLKGVPVDVIYSSVLKRTMETAGYIAEMKGLPIHSREDLKEIHGGLWERMAWTDLVEKYPEEYKTWETHPHLHQMPEGESMETFQQRLITAVQDILRKEEARNICIVTHGTAIRALLCWFKGWPLHKIVNIPWFDNTAVTIVTKEQNSYHIELEGDTSHLDATTSTFSNQEWFQQFKEKFLKNNTDGL